MKQFGKKAVRDRLRELREDGSFDKIKEKCAAKREANRAKQLRYKLYPDAPRRNYTFGTIQDS